MGETGQNMWSETCLVTITPIGSTDSMEFAIRSRDIDFKNGGKDFEGMPLNNGGRANKFKPEEDSEWSFKDCYFVGIQITGNDISIHQLFEDWENKDSNDPRSITNSRNRKKFRVSVLWTDDSSASSAEGAVASESNGYRIVAANGYITVDTENWSDGVLKTDFSFKFAPYKLDGSSNRKRDDTEGTGISALGNYTTSSNW